MKKILLLSLGALTLQCTHAMLPNEDQMDVAAAAQAAPIRSMDANEREHYFNYLMRDDVNLQQFAAAYGLGAGVMTPLYREHFGNIDFNEFVEMMGIVVALRDF